MYRGLMATLHGGLVVVGDHRPAAGSKGEQLRHGNTFFGYRGPRAEARRLETVVRADEDKVR
jgi:hypothetical protein